MFRGWSVETSQLIRCDEDSRSARVCGTVRHLIAGCIWMERKDVPQKDGSADLFQSRPNDLRGQLGDDRTSRGFRQRAGGRRAGHGQPGALRRLGLGLSSGRPGSRDPLPPKSSSTPVAVAASKTSRRLRRRTAGASVGIMVFAGIGIRVEGVPRAQAGQGVDEIVRASRMKLRDR